MMGVLASSSSVLISKQSSAERMSPTARGQTKVSSMVTTHSHILRWFCVYTCYSGAFTGVLVWTINSVVTLPMEYKEPAWHSSLGDKRNIPWSLTQVRCTVPWELTGSGTSENHLTLWKIGLASGARPAMPRDSSTGHHWPSLYMELPSKTIWRWVMAITQDDVTSLELFDLSDLLTPVPQIYGTMTKS